MPGDGATERAGEVAMYQVTVYYYTVHYTVGRALAYAAPQRRVTSRKPHRDERVYSRPMLGAQRWGGLVEAQRARQVRAQHDWLVIERKLVLRLR